MKKNLFMILIGIVILLAGCKKQENKSINIQTDASNHDIVKNEEIVKVEEEPENLHVDEKKR